eukprot:scaffold7025_cov123-Cylindrotheca_fusiformis.AAC.3
MTQRRWVLNTYEIVRSIANTGLGTRAGGSIGSVPNGNRGRWNTEFHTIIRDLFESFFPSSNSFPTIRYVRLLANLDRILVTLRTLATEQDMGHGS